MAHEERYRTSFQAIERELARRDLDYTIHGLPGADDIVHFEEYWLITPDGAKLFPAIMDADEARDLDGMIVRAIQAHTAMDDTRSYTVVLCGEGWTGEQVDGLRRRVEARLNTGIQVSIESLEQFTAGAPLTTAA
jgi:hypothetical protein